MRAWRALILLLATVRDGTERDVRGLRLDVKGVAPPELLLPARGLPACSESRVECPEHGINQVEVPWARPGSGFTLLFEALVMMMVREMSVATVARIVGVHDTRLWRILNHHLEQARAEADHSDVRAVGMDETASRRGRNYITLFADLDESRLLYAT